MCFGFPCPEKLGSVGRFILIFLPHLIESMA